MNSNENMPIDPNLDPMAMPAAEVDTRFPRLQPDRVYRFNIASAERSTSDKGNDMLTFALATTADALDTDGKTLHAGFKIYHRIMITPTGERDGKAIARDCALLLKGVGMATTSPRALCDNPEILKDKLVDAKVGIQKAKDGYPESNKISSFVIPS